MTKDEIIKSNEKENCIMSREIQYLEFIDYDLLVNFSYDMYIEIDLHFKIKIYAWNYVQPQSNYKRSTFSLEIFQLDAGQIATIKLVFDIHNISCKNDLE